MFQLVRVFTYKQPEPYNNCKKDLSSFDSFDSDIFRFIINLTGYKYRQKDCFEYCFSQDMIQKCNLSSALTKSDSFFASIFMSCEYLHFLPF